MLAPTAIPTGPAQALALTPVEQGGVSGVLIPVRIYAVLQLSMPLVLPAC